MIDVERTVIGILLLCPEYLKMIDLTENDFSDGACRRAFWGIRKLEREKKAIDALTLGTLFDNQTGLTHFIKECFINIPAVPSVQTFTDYTVLIRENSIKNRMKNHSEQLRSMIEQGENLDEIQVFVDIMAKDANYSKDDDELTLREGVVEFYKNMHTKRKYIQTGFGTLDKNLYLDKGDFIIIGGRPSAGKTAFSLNMALNIAKSYNVVFFSLETQNQKIIDRIIASYFSIPMPRIKTRSLSKEDERNFTNYLDGIDNLKFTTVNASGKSVAWIQSKALKLKADIVFVDYLGLIKSDGGNRYDKVTNISVDLHVMAQSTGITTIALSQLKRNGDSVPKMDDLRESGQIEQDADVIILLHKEGSDKGSPELANNCSVIVAKNKEGETAAVPFKFYGATQKFGETYHG